MQFSLKIFFKRLSNLKLAIFLLLIIAISTSLGSIIEQNKEIEFYQTVYNKSFLGISLSDLLLGFDLNHIYSSWWFYCLLSLLGLSLLSCTFSQQLPALKFARRYYFYNTALPFQKLELNFVNPKILTSQFCHTLIEQQYNVFQNKSSLYAYKGLIGRISPIIVHVSIILILIGSIFGSLKGFVAQEFIPKTEIFHIQNAINTNFFSNIPQYNLRVNDFWVDYNQNKKIKQFYSDLSIMNGSGQEIAKKTISVNKPFVFNGITIYQTDWEIIGARFQFPKVTNKNIQIPVLSLTDSTNNKFWLSWLPLDSEKNFGYIVVVENTAGQIQLYKQNNEFVQTLNIGQTYEIDKKPATTFKVKNLIVATGLQIKADPSIIITYTGFAFLIMSSLLSYISFSELWFLKADMNNIWGGQTNRAKIKFRIELATLQKLFPKDAN